MTRLFIALIIPDDIKKFIFELRNKAFPRADKFKWEAADKIHITLKFLGDTREELIDPISLELEKLLNGYGAMTCNLTRFGFFYNRKEARILWMGINIDNKIFDLVEKINILMKEFSFPVDKRKFNPHLTLKRLKGNEGAEFIRSFEKFEVPAVSFKTERIGLFKSELHPTGSKYTGIKIFNLK